MAKPQVQMTTYRATPSPAHVSTTVEETVASLLKRGFMQLTEKRAANLSETPFYILWHPVSYTTVEVYEER